MQATQQQMSNRQQEYQDLIRELTAKFAESLSTGEWQTRTALESRIGAKELSRAASAMGIKLTTRVGMKADMHRGLVSEILDHLMHTGRYEWRGEGTETEFRLRPPEAASATPTDPPPLVNHAQTGPASAQPTCGLPERPTSPMEEAKSAPPLGTITNGWPPPPVLVPVADLRPHPKASLVPRMPKSQWGPFLGHVKQNGVQVAILITTDNIIIDGRCRWQAARESGLTAILASIVELDETQQQICMLEAALRRRHLTDDQIAMAEEKLHKLTEPEIRKNRARKGGKAGGRGRGKQSDSLPDNVSDKLSNEHAQQMNGDDSLQDNVSGKLSNEDPQQASDDDSSTTPRKKIPERKQRVAREIEKVSPEMGDRVLAGEVSLREARKELREEGRLPPAKTPDLEPTSAETDGTATLPPPPVPTPNQSPPTDQLLFDSGTALADALINAHGLDRARQLLHDATNVVESRIAEIADRKPAGIDSTRSQ